MPIPVSPLTGSRARYYQASDHVGGSQRIVSRSLAAMEAVTTVEQAKAFAQADYDAGDVDARTQLEPQPLTLRLASDPHIRIRSIARRRERGRPAAARPCAIPPRPNLGASGGRAQAARRSSW